MGWGGCERAGRSRTSIITYRRMRQFLLVCASRLRGKYAGSDLPGGLCQRRAAPSGPEHRPASVSLGQSAACAALAGHVGHHFHMGSAPPHVVQCGAVKVLHRIGPES